MFSYKVCLSHDRLAPAALIATSNFFELAVAIAISLYGLDSGAALATVVGVLVEVPVMLALVKFCNRFKGRLEQHNKKCDCSKYQCWPRKKKAAFTELPLEDLSQL